MRSTKRGAFPTGEARFYGFSCRQAAYKLIAVGDTTTLSGEAAVKLQNPPAEGRSILRTFLQLLNPLNPLNPGPLPAAPYICI